MPLYREVVPRCGPARGLSLPSLNSVSRCPVGLEVASVWPDVATKPQDGRGHIVRLAEAAAASIRVDR